jgi:hypothetical protein
MTGRRLTKHLKENGNVQTLIVVSLLRVKVFECLGTVTTPNRLLNTRLRWQRAPFVLGLVLLLKQPLLLALWNVNW